MKWVKESHEFNLLQGSAVFDFSETGPQVYGNCNCPRAVVLSALIYCIRCMVGKDIPLNQVTNDLTGKCLYTLKKHSWKLFYCLHCYFEQVFPLSMVLPSKYLLVQSTNRSIRKMCEKSQWRCSGVFIVNFKHNFTNLSVVSVVDFEQVNVCLVTGLFWILFQCHMLLWVDMY